MFSTMTITCFKIIGLLQVNLQSFFLMLNSHSGEFKDFSVQFFSMFFHIFCPKKK